MSEKARQQFCGRDYALIALIGAVLFGYAAVSGKPLTMHEARLPQTAREMMANGEWLFPHSGERPWLERPPLPHWCEIVTAHVVGRLDREWVARLPAAVMGTLVLVLLGSLTSRLFGRSTGLLTAAILATMYEFYFYAGQAEDEIFLAAAVTAAFALVAAMEFPPGELSEPRDTRFLGNRPWPMWGLFIVLGLTNLIKGPLIGAVTVIFSVATFLALARDRQRVRAYLWLWGWILFIALGFAWPIAAYCKFEGVLENWKWDYAGTFGHEPPWYYLLTLLWTTAPWTPLMLAGCFFAIKFARTTNARAEKFVLCWAIVPLLIISVQARKHHHYLLPILPAWAILAALGANRLAPWLFRKYSHPIRNAELLIGIPIAAAITLAAYLGKLPGPTWMLAALAIISMVAVAGIADGLSKSRGTQVMSWWLAGFACFAAWGQSVLGKADELKWGDVPLAQRTGNTVPRDNPLFIEAGGSLDFFRFQFYSRSDAQLLHNITFLRDQRITAPEVYVLARAEQEKFIHDQIGQCEVIDRSTRSRHERSPADRWVLFQVRFKEGLPRYPAPKINVLQAMARGTGNLAGPYCGPPPNE